MSYVYNIPELLNSDVVRRFLTPSPSQQKANPTSNDMAQALFAQNADYLSSQGAEEYITPFYIVASCSQACVLCCFTMYNTEPFLNHICHQV